jgi:hypothetical protein
MIKTLMDEYNSQNEHSQSFDDFVVDRVGCDLSDKGFSEEEQAELIGDNISENIKGSISIDTQYLFVAYALSLLEDYYSKEELVALMNDCEDCVMDEIEEDDINKIWEKSKNLT